MARAGSEDPRDVANLQALVGQLRGAQAEMERLLALATEQVAASEQATTRAAADRQAAARETRTRRKEVGRGGTPTGRASELAAEPALIEEGAAATSRATIAEEARTSAVRERVRLEREAARQGRLPVPIGRAGDGFTYAQTAGERIRAQGDFTQQRLAGLRNERAETEALARAEAARVAAQQVARRSQPLLGPGAPQQRQIGPGTPPVVPPTGAPQPGVQLPRIPRSPGIDLSGYHDLSQAERTLVDQALKLEQVENGLARAISYNSRVVGLSSNAYQKHGYLTSEFIQAAGRGQVTFRELGNQVGGTIAKFAGWTAAAAAVYGALGAVSALGRGAIDSASGVQLLNRVIDQTKRGGISDDQLQGRVGDLSRRFNVPVEEANQAAYGSLKAFHGDLPSALQASEQALFAVKVGELSAADATTKLTAIVNGFKLEASDLPQLFDTINQAQNRFGGNTGALVSGVAKAGGAFRLAGGQYRDLIAILTAGSRLTGRTPVEIATAVQRSAGRVLTQPGQEALKQAGLDPDQSYPRLLAQASQLAKGASKERVEELARALVPSGGQFAAVFAPLLQNPALRKNVFDALAPDLVKGSASRELKRVLSEPREQIQQIGGDLERLGVTLARLGAGAGPGVLLHGLDLVLRTADDVLKVFNAIAGITGPFKNVTAGALELVAVLRLLRRFDVGSSLPARAREGGFYNNIVRGGLTRAEVPRQRAQVLRGLDDQAAFIQQERARYAVRAAALGTEKELARQDVVTTRANPNATSAELTAAQRRFNQVNAQMLQATRLETVYREQAVATERQITGFQAANIRSAQQLEAALAEQKILHTIPTLNRPSGGVPSEVGASGSQLQLFPTGAAAHEAEDAARKATTEAADQQKRMAVRMREGLTAQEAAFAATASNATGAKVAAQKVGLKAKAAGVAMVESASAAALAARSFGASLLASIGPLGGVLIGLYAVEEFIAHQKEVNRKRAETLAKIRAVPKTQADLDRQRQYLKEQRGPIETFDKPPDPSATPDIAAAQLGDTKVRRAANRALQNLPRPEELVGSITRDLEADFTRFQQGRISIDSLNNLLDEGLDRLKTSPASAAQKHDVRQRIQDIQTAVTQGANYYDRLTGGGNSLGTVGDEVIDKQNQGFQAILAVGQQTGAQMEHFFARELAVIARNRGAAKRGDPGAQQRVGQAIEAVQSVLQQAQANLQVELQRATTPGGRQTALRSFRTTLRAPLRAERAELQALTRNRTRLRKQLDDAADEYNRVAEETNHGFGTIGNIGIRSSRGGSAALANARATRRRLKQLLISLGLQMADVKAALALLTGALADAKRDTAAMNAQIASERIEANTALAVARAGTPGGEYQAQHRGDQQIAKLYKPGSNEWKQAQAQVIGGAKAEAQRVAAEGKAAAEKAKADAEAAAQAAREAADARYAYLEALAGGDSLRVDRLEVARAQSHVRSATTTADRYNAMAEEVNAKRKLREDVTNRRIEDLDYEAEIGKITQDQEVRALQNILRTTKLGIDFKRDLRMKIGRLKHDAESSYALDISNVRLPTPYEVTRAIKEGRATSGASITQHNSTSVVIHVRDGKDLQRVVNVFDRELRTRARSVLRAQGVA